jgi:hypothetical protein
MATEYTPNYNLDLYASADKPNLRDQYNAAMGKVDALMKKTADDVTNANANVLTMQSQVSKNKEDIAALESTVETHGVQITGAQKTADDALSLAQTNETDIAGTQADVTALTGRVSAVEGVASKNKADISTLNANVSQKAPTDHASSTTLYGQGTATKYGHVKVTDSGIASAATGTAASPQMVSQVAGQVSSLTEQWGAAPASIGSALSRGCHVSAWGKVVTVTCSDVSIPGNAKTQIGTLGAKYAPAVVTTGTVGSSSSGTVRTGYLQVDTSGKVFINMQTGESTSEGATGVLTYLAG